jgi:hypothetical protein
MWFSFTRSNNLQPSPSTSTLVVFFKAQSNINYFFFLNALHKDIQRVSTSLSLDFLQLQPIDDHPYEA